VTEENFNERVRVASDELMRLQEATAIGCSLRVLTSDALRPESIESVIERLCKHVSIMLVEAGFACGVRRNGERVMLAALNEERACYMHLLEFSRWNSDGIVIENLCANVGLGSGGLAIVPLERRLVSTEAHAYALVQRFLLSPGAVEAIAHLRNGKGITKGMSDLVPVT